MPRSRVWPRQKKKLFFLTPSSPLPILIHFTLRYYSRAFRATLPRTPAPCLRLKSAVHTKTFFFESPRSPFSLYFLRLIFEVIRDFAQRQAAPPPSPAPSQPVSSSRCSPIRDGDRLVPATALRLGPNVRSFAGAFRKKHSCPFTLPPPLSLLPATSESPEVDLGSS